MTTHYCPRCVSRPVLVPALLLPGQRSARKACTVCNTRWRVVDRPEAQSKEFSSTDGGRASAGFEHETKDCSVRAWALAKGISYAESHAAFKAAGRVDRKGTTDAVSRAVMGEATWSAPSRRMCQSYAAWLRLHPVGTYVLHTVNHALCVIDGQQRDNGTSLHKPRSRVIRYWRIA